MYRPKGMANKSVRMKVILMPKISVFIIKSAYGLKFLGFYQYITEVAENQDGDDE
jgi:hypothetical protein